MARMLTEEEVKRMEEQRALRERARAAGNPTAGMSEEERQRYVFNKAHADAMERRRQRVLADPSAEADTTYRHSVMRGEEMRLAREDAAKRLGMELATREKEAHEKRMGMGEQGRDAAEFNKDAAIRVAELQTAGAEKVAGINRDRDVGVAKINAESAEKINEGKNKTAVEVANVNYDTSVDTAQVQANVQAAKEYAQEMMRKRQVDEKTALEYGKSVITEAQRMVNNSKNKSTGRRTMTMEEAIKKVEEVRRRMGTVPGEPRELGSFKR